ncbi:MAG: hypothetical protein K1X39_08435 [Thermoflexales bacterium]|nr:hypothetical protein [Thermoflexales bacterium]
MNDPLAVLISFVYVFLALGIAEGLRRGLKLDLEFTRKFVHIAVGMWAWGTATLFQNKWMAIITPAIFVVLNSVSYRYGLFLAMESRNKSNLGTIFFPIAFIVVLLLFWEHNKAFFVASLMPMTWGDAFAAIIGKRFGRHCYRLVGSTRSVEGSLTMLLLSFVATAAALLVFGVAAWLPISLVVALAATVVEALSPYGLDNLLVPAISAAALTLLG